MFLLNTARCAQQSKSHFVPSIKRMISCDAHIVRAADHACLISLQFSLDLAASLVVSRILHFNG